MQQILLRLLIEMQCYLDYEEIFGLMFKYKMLDIVFEYAESADLSDDSRDKFALEFFRYALVHDNLDMAILLIDHYRMQLFRFVDNCMESII